MNRTGNQKKGLKMPYLIAVCIILLFILIIMIIFPISSGKLPERKKSGGISERVRIETDAGSLELMLLSDNIENPVLLVCGGGPGIPQYLLENSYPSALPEEFTVAYWDYRGTGASFRTDTAAEEMTTGRYVQDAVAVTEYLSKRFSNEKIFIMGHSFGTYLALKTVQRHPELYKAYIAMSQIVNQPESEYLAFDYMKEQYEHNGNAKMVEQFNKYDIRSSGKDYDAYFFSGLRDKAMHDLGVGTTRDMRSVISGIFFPSLKCKAYTQAERINIWRGKARSASFPVTKDAISFNAPQDVPEIEIPIIFIVGSYDYTCCAGLQKEYFDHIKAPEKELYVFENSAHSPLYEEYDKAKQVLADIRKKYY